MRVLQSIFGFLLALLVMVTCSPGIAIAASSGAIRAFDDVAASTKDFSGQDLSRAEFGDAKLQGANFSSANLQGAVFNGAVLKEANFHAADFSNGIAYITDLRGADLTDAILESAMMLKTNFKDAKITGADFTFATIDRSQILMLCKTASGTNPVTGVDTRESLGC
ncbi:MAG TPA: pentapeptide repeat-containing protein [Coleofasciculaceae cyanobacterium]|jgi:uncharacterized protein YjbI with pentapeptide repeats